MKNSLKIGTVLLIITIAALLFVSRNLKREDLRIEALGSNQIVVGSKSSAESFAEDLRKHDQYWTHVHRARGYADAGKYSESKVEYTKAIATSRGAGDVWMVRDGLKDMYVKSGQLDLAVQEIEWLMQNNKRPDVIQSLIDEKSRLLAASAKHQ